MSLLGIYAKDAQSYNKGICSTMFIAALFVIVRTWNNLYVPLPKGITTEEGIKKMWYIYTTEYYSVIKSMTS